MKITCISLFIIFLTIIDLSCIFSVYFAHFVDIALVPWSQSMVPSRGGWLLPRRVDLWCRAWPSDWWVPVGHVPQYRAARQEVWQHADRLLPGLLSHGEEGLSQVQDGRRGWVLIGCNEKSFQGMFSMVPFKLGIKYLSFLRCWSLSGSFLNIY